MYGDVAYIRHREHPYVKQHLQEVLQEIDYMHAARKIHRDIKSDNIFISPAGDVKLGDFGFTANLYKKSKRSTVCRTP
jgi:serine/threonine protein kinase